MRDEMRGEVRGERSLNWSESTDLPVLSLTDWALARCRSLLLARSNCTGGSQIRPRIRCGKQGDWVLPLVKLLTGITGFRHGIGIRYGLALHLKIAAICPGHGIRIRRGIALHLENTANTAIGPGHGIEIRRGIALHREITARLKRGSGPGSPHRDRSSRRAAAR